jgi:hypothetical protein
MGGYYSIWINHWRNNMTARRLTTPFRAAHYEYLADTILRDTDITERTRAEIYYSLEVWFKRDFDNFNQKKWNERWKDRFL